MSLKYMPKQSTAKQVALKKPAHPKKPMNKISHTLLKVIYGHISPIYSVPKQNQTMWENNSAPSEIFFFSLRCVPLNTGIQGDTCIQRNATQRTTCCLYFTSLITWNIFFQVNTYMATIHYTHEAYCQEGCTQAAHRPQEAHLCHFIEHTEHSLFYVKSYMATMYHTS